jgi:hypothetical protein
VVTLQKSKTTKINQKEKTMASPFKVLDDLMQKEVDRKEFLKIAGAGLLGIIGVTGALQSLGKIASPSQQSQSRGYGSSPYGK